MYTYKVLLSAFLLIASSKALWPFDESENTVGATPTQEPWWERILGGETGTTSTLSTQTPVTQSQAISQTSAVSSVSSSEQPWYASFFSNQIVISSSTSKPPPATATAIAHFGITTSQTPSASRSTKLATSDNVLESFIAGLGLGKTSSSSSVSSLNSTTASRIESSDSVKATDETESNRDGDGILNPYSPINVTCPSHSIVREANGLSTGEKDYILSRQELTNRNLIDFLSNRANLSDFDSEHFINENSRDHNITIGLAFSGGGYRAMLSGAGSLLALDNRFEDSNTNGLGGLLQSTTYLSGLSGGSWLVGSLVLNNWISVQELFNGSANMWNLEDSFLNPNSLSAAELAKYYLGVGTAVDAKNQAGFKTSLTDLWGRVLSHQFFDDSSGGVNVTWSGVRNFSTFEDHSMPYFFVVANGKVTSNPEIDQNSTFIVEMSAYELGNFDNSLKSFVDIEYLGSNIENGESSQCVKNFDNGGFLMGTSSSLFNQIFMNLSGYDVGMLIRPVVETVLSDLTDDKTDVAIFEPNPFYESTYGSIESVGNNRTLTLVDGGENGQNVPFYPLIQKDRNVDVIFAFDNSADTQENWPNGTSFVETYKWQFTDQGKGTPFPFVPDVKTYLNKGLGEKPIFFGCNASSLSPLIKWHGVDERNETDIPLVVYVSSNHQSYLSNFSTFKLSYDNAEKFGTIQNGYEVVTSKNLTDDTEWATCVGCAIIRRQQDRLGEKPSQECERCFKRYCWTGTLDLAPKVDVDGLYTNSSTNHNNNNSSSILHNNATSTISHNSTSTSTRHSPTVAAGSFSQSTRASQTTRFYPSTSITSKLSIISKTTTNTLFNGVQGFTVPSVVAICFNFLLSVIF
ncbi:plb1 [Candida oxycetoniae]|uniref:Lysophospholipase n=1 Tax=Candida oxycetoniae TaxID=497107 RepID=A0AAI9SZZ5_9ASCO|nr:plb1 [Candida oxycetoniae]KAI3405686.2 plb1 [Candida oxycetoniae]